MNCIKSVVVIALLLISSVSQAASLMLQAEGQGENLEQAKASALTNLSQLVISQVESEFSSDVAVKNEEVNKNIRSKKRVTSNILFKSVQYVNELRDDSGVQITAGLDRQGLEDTINFMREKLQVDFELLNADQQEDALLISQQLSALLHSIPPAAQIDTQNLSNWTKQRRQALLKRLNQGQLIFVTTVADYSVKVDGKPVQTGDFFPHGSYTFVASADGYRDVSGRFSVSAGSTIKINLPFIEKVNGKLVVLTITNGNEALLRDQAIETLAGLGVNVAENVPQRIELSFLDNTSEVDGFVTHQLEVKMVAYKDNIQVKKISSKKNLTVEGNDQKKVVDTARRLVDKGLMALLAKIDLQDYFAVH